MSTAPIRRFQFATLVAVFILPLTIFASESKAQTSGLFPYSAQERAYIRSLPITQRPNRPFHFYGNAVRRNTVRAPRAATQVFIQPLGSTLPGLSPIVNGLSAPPIVVKN